MDAVQVEGGKPTNGEQNEAASSEEAQDRWNLIPINSPMSWPEKDTTGEAHTPPVSSSSTKKKVIYPGRKNQGVDLNNSSSETAGVNPDSNGMISWDRGVQELQMVLSAI